MNRHQHTRLPGRDGAIRVVKSVSRCRVIPGWHAVDPLTLPFRARPSVVARMARRHGYTADEARAALGCA